MTARSLEDQILGKMLAEKYKLIDVQASGAFGTVFLAHQFFCKQFVRPVAVKVSRETGLTEETAPYLFGDALILAQLLAGGEHDEGRLHLVQIFDMGLLPQHDDRAFLVMEYVEGVPLFSHMAAAGTISVKVGLRFIKEICRALSLIHRQGAVHRDLKADNILVDRRGIVRVVDFGLAAFTDARSGFVSGAMGTFTYMAPETLWGRATPASDVYSLGLMMYELFTGGGPHLTAAWRNAGEEDHREEHFNIKKSLPFVPPSEVQNEIRFDYKWLDALILRCLDTDPERRFDNAGKLLEAITACEAGEPLPALPPRVMNYDPGDKGMSSLPPTPTSEEQDAETEQMFREIRRLLGRRNYDEVIDRLDVHRPAEWTVLDRKGIRILRALGQAYLGLGDLATARECLEHLRSAQAEQPLLSKQDYAASLTDLFKVYRKLGLPELAQACQEEARKLL